MRETLDEARAIVSGSPTDYSLMKAVWLADLAAELILATVVSDLELGLEMKGGANPAFKDYLDVISRDNKHLELNSLKLHFASLRSLHSARNRVHDGLAFTINNSRSLVQKADLFVQTAFADVYGLDVDKLSLTSFLKPSLARDHLEDAELKIEQQSYSEAMLEVAIALELGRRQLRRLLREKQNSDLWSEKLFPHISRQPRTISLEERSIKKLAYFFELSRYGIDVDKAIKYSERVPGVIGNRDEGPWISESGLKKEYSASEAQEYFYFVADALYRFQSYSAKL